MKRVFVTGMGMITTIGETVVENLYSLREGKCGITNLTLFDSKYADLCPFGEIKVSNEVLKSSFQLTTDSVTRTSLLALNAMQEAIFNGGLNTDNLTSENTALITGNTVGGMCLTDSLYQDANSTKEASQYINSYDLGSIPMFLQEHYGLKGIVNNINTACSSSANAIMHGTRLIQHGFANRAIVGGVDSLAKFTINGFNSLHLLSNELCNPFSEDRKGLNLGEGAAFLILESEDVINADTKIHAEITGYANVSDAYHPSSLSDEGTGPFLAMTEALKKAQLKTSQIDYINVHGTGTENNDFAEAVAMKKVFQEKIPPFSSTKSSIGHTLGGAGAIESIYSILSIQEQEIFPQINFSNPMNEKLQPITENKKTSVNNVMSNSFGFGGNCTSLIFSKVN